MTQISPCCADRRLRSAVWFVTPSHGSTPRAPRSSKLKSFGSVLSSQIVTRPGYAVAGRPRCDSADLLGRPGRGIAGREGLLRLLGDPVALRRPVPATGFR